MNNEFLRRRENSCKWFNTFGKEERNVYIVKGEKTQFSHKFNRLNRFTKCLNRFRYQKDRPEKYEGWYDSKHIWVDSSVPRMKIEAIQTSYESIQDKSGSFVRRCIHESIHIKSETLLNRFRLWWVDSNWSKNDFLTLFQTTQINKTKPHRLQGVLTCYNHQSDKLT